MNAKSTEGASNNGGYRCDHNSKCPQASVKVDAVEETVPSRRHHLGKSVHWLREIYQGRIVKAEVVAIMLTKRCVILLNYRSI